MSAVAASPAQIAKDEMSVKVKSQIAAFERHNETVRKSSPKSSPGRTTSTKEKRSQNNPIPGFNADSNDHNGHRYHHDGAGSSSAVPPSPNRRGGGDSSVASHDMISVASDHSPTGQAAKSRRNRLLQEHGGEGSVGGSCSSAGGGTGRGTGSNSGGGRDEGSSKPALSLAERRKQRQQRKAQLMQKRTSNGRRRDPTTVATSSLSKTHPIPPPSTTSAARSSLHADSAESYDSPGPTPRPYRSSGSRSMRMKQRATATAFDDDTQYHDMLQGMDGTDDEATEATQTSVRQVMKNTNPPSLLKQQQLLYQRHHPYQLQNQPIQPVHIQQQLQQQLLRTASSSSYETDTRQAMYDQIPDSGTNTREADDDTQDYASFMEGESVTSTTNRRKIPNHYHQQPQHHQQQQQQNYYRSSATAAQLASSNSGPVDGYMDTVNSPLMNKDDMEHYRKSLDTPIIKTAAGVVAAATVGTLILGPVGLLVGAATVGIGVGVMQIPQEQRNHMQHKATQALHRAHESAVNASEALSHSCAAQCQNSGVMEQLPQEMKACFSTPEDMMMDPNLMDPNADPSHMGQQSHAQDLQQHGLERQRSDNYNNVMNNYNYNRGGVNASNRSMMTNGTDGTANNAPTQSGGGGANGRSRRSVACLRNVRITPVDQIHGLAPSQQPRAWLDVLASSNTSADEKSEAIEEILILAKDKRHARFLLDEGILDSLMYILNRHFEQSDGLHIPSIPLSSSFTSGINSNNMQVVLAATCCVILGKAHCAAVHTEGDLLLMSLYERGTVPEERQLAQMLYEVPHHVLTKEPDVFILQQSSMSQAQESAKRIKSLAKT